MLKKTVEFSTPGTRLSVSHRQLVIERPNSPKATLPIEDLGVVIVDDMRATYTQSVFVRLLDAGATVMISSYNHLPMGMMLPLDAHHAQTESHHAQANASEPLKKRLWQSIVQAKIKQQSIVLDHFNQGNTGGLVHMARRVRSGDPDNLEAQAAQRYWPLLFGVDFRRDRHADGINALLNYGYSVVRAALARALVGAGLIPSLGVFHHNRNNPFCLADDVLEPYRPFVDWRVRQLVTDYDTPALSLDNQGIRAALLSLFNETIAIGDLKRPLLLALHSSAVSLCKCLTQNQAQGLILPSGLPIESDLFEADSEYD